MKLTLTTFSLFILFLLGCSEDYQVLNHTPGIVKIFGNNVFVAYGQGGLIVYDEATGQEIAQLFPPREMKSIDDFDVDGDLVFILDSRGHDYIAVYSFINNEFDLITSPQKVEGGPFNGVSAAGGNLVVSGGTSFLNRFTYSSDGMLSGPISFGRDRGHPDVLLSSNGYYAFISTDFEIGLDIERFGVISLALGEGLTIPFVVSELGIEGAGFSKGVTSPVGFPIQTTIFNDYLLVAHGAGLTAIRLIENSIFDDARNYDINLEATAIIADEAFAFITGFQNDNPVLIRVDLTDINFPTIVSTETLAINTNIPTSIAVSQNFIYIAAGSAGLLKLTKN